MIHLTFRVPQATANKLKRYAESHGLNNSVAIRRIVEKFLSSDSIDDETAGYNDGIRRGLREFMLKMRDVSRELFKTTIS